MSANFKGGGEKSPPFNINTIADIKSRTMQPRIYTYKITFEEVPYYYYGVHKEKVFNEEYWGTPYVNKWCWEIYTPKKQILELFDYTDNGWLKANLVEDRLIRPFYQTDEYCLNESCGGRISLSILRKNGKRAGDVYGKITYKNRLGIFSLTDEEKRVVCSKAGKRSAEIHHINQTGFYGLTLEDRIENGRKGGTISGNNNKKNKTGFCGRSEEKMSEDGRKAGKVSANQRWKCTETGFITNAGNLTKYQRARGIDTSKRMRVNASFK